MTIRLLRRPEVEQLVGLSRSTIYNRLEKGTFPKPVPLGGRLVAWVESDIQAWIQERIEAAGRA
ncbi:helix-turn-helix transcriptional regulator [Neptunomonas concharum]|uniref:AlpA family transcriptional regulator n=1 Tax=Neptunomonas concharum TaxID=1031538 RepID=A0A5P1RCJ3_9GAMM|nr:AlpA family transcriptional regulator [Neptunomonas concharum]QEQ97323.1 AlpA family transcriptional regulator [Neptunomonas concharum]